MARDYKKLDPEVAQGFYFAKKKKKNGEVLLTRIHPDKEAEYKKAGWTIEKPVDPTAMPEEK